MDGSRFADSMLPIIVSHFVIRPQGNHPAASSPLTWPLSLHGALFWSKEVRRFYDIIMYDLIAIRPQDRVLFLTGNAPVWWAASASLLALALAAVSALLPGKQKQDTPTPVVVPYAKHVLLLIIVF